MSHAAPSTATLCMAMNEQQTIRAIFAGGHTVAVVGLSPKAWRESFGVSRAMQAAGWRIIPVNPVVAEMGVDGHLSVGYTPTPKEITITLAADSKSRPVFDDWQAYQDAAKEVYVCSAQFIVPGIGKTFTGLRGALTAAQPMPNAAKTLQAPAYNITFESWTPSSL